jgi:hypothetical protein
MSAMPMGNTGLGLVGIDDETQARMQEALATALQRRQDGRFDQPAVGGISEQESRMSEVRLLNTMRAREMQEYFSSPVGRFEAAGLDALRYAVPAAAITRYGAATTQAIKSGMSGTTRAVLPQRAAQSTINFANMAEKNVLGPVMRTTAFGSPRALTPLQKTVGPIASPVGASVILGPTFARSVTTDNTQIGRPLTAEDFAPEPEPSFMASGYDALKTARNVVVKPLKFLRNIASAPPAASRLEEMQGG